MSSVTPPSIACLCRLCGHAQHHILLSLRDVPRWNHRLLRVEEVAQDHGIDLQVLKCNFCGFVSLFPGLDVDYYDDYILVPSRSVQAQQFQLGQAREFVSRFGLQGKPVLEVGCGDGFFLAALCDAGARVVGVEPSLEQCAIARDRGLTVVQGMLTEGKRLPQAPFSGFATRQVFEHVEDMRGFLMAIRENLADQAYGLVEVPNLEMLIAHARFFDFIPEHVNYFTSRTLNVALSLVGFEVLEILPVDEGESLRAFVRWKAENKDHQLQAGVGLLRANFEQFMHGCRERGQRVAIYGAGGKGLSIMSMLDLTDVAVVVDADPAKENKWTPVSHREVLLPHELLLRGIDAVIVTAPAYQFEIARYMRNELKFQGLIALASTGFTLFEGEGDT